MYSLYNAKVQNSVLSLFDYLNQNKKSQPVFRLGPSRLVTLPTKLAVFVLLSKTSLGKFLVEFINSTRCIHKLHFTRKKRM